MKKKDWLYFLLLAVLFGVFFYFVGEDSPLHDIFYSRDHIDRRDTPWFFTCGKALMNGMVPYVEFADSKGPLLWLIYGLAYVISPDDYFGVWIINGIGYLGVLLCMYLTVKMFVKKEGVAFLLTLLTVPFLFIPDIHYETKSEDSALIFIALSFWQCVRILYEEKLTDKDWWRAFFLWGLCFGGTLLIKYNSSLNSVNRVRREFTIFIQNARHTKTRGCVRSLLVHVLSIIGHFRERSDATCNVRNILKQQGIEIAGCPAQSVTPPGSGSQYSMPV